jgi:hypothetical protein
MAKLKGGLAAWVKKNGRPKIGKGKKKKAAKRKGK